jgi:hypothetical protein
MLKNIKNILIDLRYAKYFLDQPDYRGMILYDVAKAFCDKGKNIYFHVLDRAEKYIIKKQNAIPFTRFTDLSQMDEIDFYIGFAGGKHRKKRKHMRKNNKPMLVYESGPLPQSVLLDKHWIFGDGYTAKHFDTILKNQKIGDIQAYCNHLVKNDLSKRTQKGDDKIPNSDFIFIPGQALRDASVKKKYTRTGLLDFISYVTEFAYNNNIDIVFKPHPGLKGGKRHGRQKQLDHCLELKKRYGNLHIVRNSIFKILDKSLFMATVNCGSVVDAFVTQTPTYCCGRSFYMNTGALVFDEDVNRGLNRMAGNRYDKEAAQLHQLKTISWLRSNLLFNQESAPENLKRIMALIDK